MLRGRITLYFNKTGRMPKLINIFKSALTMCVSVVLLPSCSLPSFDYDNVQKYCKSASSIYSQTLGQELYQAATNQPPPDPTRPPTAEQRFVDCMLENWRPQELTEIAEGPE